MKRLIAALCLAAFLAPTPVDAAQRKRQPQASQTTKHKRSAAAKRAFMRQSGYPHGRPGYVVDHIIPLACGGADAPYNMQWQTIAEAKAKDRWERKGCQQ